MRRLVVATLLMLGVTVGVLGCAGAPTDPYRDMKMLTPAEAGVSQQAQDPVLEAEKAYNAKFTPKNSR
jgi:hypothetical protein